MTSGRWSAAVLQRLTAAGGRDYLVAAHRQVDPQRPQDLRLVIDDEDFGFQPGCRSHAAPVLRRCGELDLDGEPAAGGIGGRDGAAHRLDESASDRKAKADADAVVVVAEPLERCEQLFLGAARYSGAFVDDGDQHSIADLARGDADRTVRRVPQRVVDQVGQHPLEQAAVGHHHGVADLDLHPVEPLPTKTGGALADSEQGALHGLFQVHAPQLGTKHPGGQPRRVEQVADECGELVDGLLDGGQQFGGVLGGEVDIAAAQARHRGLGGGKGSAQVVADRGQQ